MIAFRMEAWQKNEGWFHMQVTWFGQAAFHLQTDARSVVIDPFAAFAPRAGMVFDYLPLPRLSPELVLITHEHFDHNGLEALHAPKMTIRSTAGRFQTPIGEVVAIAGEHDDVAGTRRGPNTIFRFDLDGLRIAHFGDFGQKDLRSEQLEQLGPLDLVFLPVGAGPTIGPEKAHEIALAVDARYIVPMHYRTPAVNFLEPLDPFLKLWPEVLRPGAASFDTSSLPQHGPLCVVPEMPTRA